LDDALVEPAARGVAAEIDVNVLRGERRRRYDKCRYRGRYGNKTDAAAS
jgi:hypothetical protein